MVSFAQNKKKVLMLGGTSFVGPYIVKEALDKGFDVTLFNRGITNPQLFQGLRKLRGDRMKLEDLRVLIAEPWDVVIDTWQRNPHAVRYTAEIFKKKVPYYAYVSSVAIYGGQNFRKVGIIEEAPLPELGPLPVAADDLGYIKDKIHSENLVREAFPSSHGTFRAHTIYGLDTATGSLNNPSIGIASRAYWPVRFDKGGDILAPGEKTDTCQFTDVKDLARFIIHCIQQQKFGAYNVFNTLTMDELFKTLLSIKSTKTKANLIWVPADFIFKNGLESFSHIPLWVSHKEVGNGFFQISTEKARKAGMKLTPAAVTFNETKQAFYKYHADFDFTSGPRLAKSEEELLNKFKIALR